MATPEHTEMTEASCLILTKQKTEEKRRLPRDWHQLLTPESGLTWHKHIFAKQKQLGIILNKMYWLLGHKSKLSTSNKLIGYKTILKPI
jgi:hypothetical protein